MALEAKYAALTDGLRDTELRASLNKDMGVYEGSESDVESFLSPECWLDNTTVDACIRLFTTPFSKQMVSLPTWNQPMEDFGGVQRPARQRVNLAMSAEGGKALKAVIWPFLIANHFILCIIRPNGTATILDSMGRGARFVGIVQTQLAKYESWQHWRIMVGQSALQNNMNDCGIYCIANAAYTIANHPLPATINVDFWRIACWSAMGMADTDHDLAQSTFFYNLRDYSSPDHVIGPLRRIQNDHGLAVLETLAVGPPNPWWLAWYDMVGELNRKTRELREIRSATVRNPARQDELQRLQVRVILMLDELDKHERSSEKTRQQLAIHVAAHQRLLRVLNRMEHLEDVGVLIIRGNVAGGGEA